MRSTSPFIAVEDSTPRSWCSYVVGLQKSADRLRAQRSAPSAADGSKACSKQEAGGRGPSHERISTPPRKRWRPEARERGRTHGAKGRTVRSGSGDPHHVSAASRRKHRGRVRALARASRAKLLSMEGISGRRSAGLFTRQTWNRSWRPSRSRIDSQPRVDERAEWRRRQRCQRWSGSIGGRKKTPHARIERGTEVRVAP